MKTTQHLTKPDSLRRKLSAQMPDEMTDAILESHRRQSVAPDLDLG